jgi:hypothetical protein
MNQKFNFTKLDARTRGLMVEEITAAHESGELYYNTRFTSSGQQSWPKWLLAAAKDHDEHWLAYQIEAAGAMEHLEPRTKPKGGYTLAHVPDIAAETLADSQFNRFYIAAICRRAIEDGKPSVRVYRAKLRGVPRRESVALEGSMKDAATLLREVRSRDLSLKCAFLKPNSGLSIDY